MESEEASSSDSRSDNDSNNVNPFKVPEQDINDEDGDTGTQIKP